ncbi:hypothetical protein [Brevundimonas sp. R86498]|uniref:hypothetical protein n=1 Tax=Brevundimonas sp. R86498 TaxID=3093845 RepID=UPI0037CC428F
MPSGAAVHLLNVLESGFSTRQAARAAAVDWIIDQGLNGREITSFFTGTTAELRPKYLALIPQLVRDLVNEERPVSEFVNSKTPKNYPLEFVREARSSNELLGDIGGIYLVLRPGTDILDAPMDSQALELGSTSKHEKLEYAYNIVDDDKNSLLVTPKGIGQPSTFEYHTTTKTGRLVGSWKGIVVASEPFVYFLGFCPHGEDVGYMVLRKHSDRKLASSKVFVGMQSLIMRHPKGGARHFVTRPIAAVPTNQTSQIDDIHMQAAHDWINDERDRTFFPPVLLEVLSSKS